MSNLHAKRVAHNNENASSSSDDMTWLLLMFAVVLLMGADAPPPHTAGADNQTAANNTSPNISGVTNQSLILAMAQMNATNAALQNTTAFDKNLTKIANAAPSYPKPFVSNTSMQNYRQPR